MKYCFMGWQEKVYKPSQNDLREYESLFNKFAKEFRYTCQSCRRQFTKKSRLLGLHHIIPRAQGGTDDWDNLVLICKPCHNIIELTPQKYRTYNSIAYALAQKKPKFKDKPIGKKWQSWVYGGAKNPLKG